MPYCNDCGGFVSKAFVRVCGRDGDVAACLDCRDKTEITNGAAMPER